MVNESGYSISNLTLVSSLAAFTRSSKAKANSNDDLLTEFLKSRRQGLSPETLIFYKSTIKPFLRFSNGKITTGTICQFLASLTCSSNTKHAYFKGIKVFVRWLFKTRRIKEDPLILIDSPKETKAILPSLTREQMEYLIAQADNLRDKTIIALLGDSGMRLKEIGNIKVSDIDWESMTITIWGKGSKQRRAPFAAKSGDLLMQYLGDGGSNNNGYGNIWNLRARSIQCMLGRLSEKTGITFSTHAFRRGFASNLHRTGLDVEHIMRLGGWESLDMVLRYTRSVKFEDSLKLYRNLNS